MISVSILVPVISSDHLLPATISSCLPRTNSTWEVILIDARATGSERPLKWGGKPGNRIRLVRGAGLGLAGALNLGVANARGRYITWLYPGEAYARSRLERQIGVGVGAGAGAGDGDGDGDRAVVSDFVVLNQDGHPQQTVAPVVEKDELVLQLFQDWPLPGGAVLVPRAQLESVGGFSDGGVADLHNDLWFRLIENGMEFTRSPGIAAWLHSTEPFCRRHDDHAASRQLESIYTTAFEKHREVALSRAQSIALALLVRKGLPRTAGRILDRAMWKRRVNPIFYGWARARTFVSMFGGRRPARRRVSARSNVAHRASGDPRRVDFVFPYGLSPGGIAAGGATATVQLAEAIALRGLEVQIAARLHPAGPPREVLHQGVHYRALDADWEIDAGKGSARSLVLVLFDDQRAVVGNLEPDERCTRAIFYHNAHPHWRNFRLAEFYMTWPDVVFCPSEFSRRSLIAWGLSANRVVVIPNGLPGDLKTERRVRRRSGLFLFVGAPVAEKGIHLLLDAFSRFSSRIPDVRLVVAGDAALWGRETVQSARAIPGSVSFAGALTKRELAAQYSAASFMVLPSFSESFGLVVLEAMSFGCIPITSSAGALPELVQDGVNGLLCREQTVAAWEHQLERARGLSAQERARMSGRAKRTSRGYRWDTSADRFLSALGLSRSGLRS